VSRTKTVMQEPGLPLLLRIIYFFLFGWWAAGVWINAAWFLNAVIVGLPLGLWMLNRVPQVLTLRPYKQMVVSTATDSGVVQKASSLPQRSWPVRALYFVLIGWWLSFLWSNLAWAISLTVIGLPLAIWMFNRLPGVTTLMRT
jgi:uncharacterized membrane protein YccF (DUF307 family)